MAFPKMIKKRKSDIMIGVLMEKFSNLLLSIMI